MSLTDQSQVSTETILQLIGSTQTVGAETPVVDRIDASANIVECHGTVVPTAATAGYAKNATFRKTDAAAGVTGLYTNTGTTSSCTFSTVDTSLPGDTASSLIDTNSLTVVDVATVASQVNHLRVTPSATGAVSANAVVLQPNGTDAAISITIVPVGVTGIVTLGAATQTGAINLGIATTATTSTVNVSSANGTASTQTVEIGGGTSTTSGGKIVNIANGIPGTSTTNTVAIGTGGTTTGTVGITVGSNGNAAHTTAIQGGSGATAITLTPQTTGVITVGAPAGTGDVVVGSSSGSQAVKIGNGAGVSTVNIANVSVAGANVNLATVATGAGITDTVAISTGNAAATGIKVVNILTGTPGTSGNNRLTMGGGLTSAVTVNAAFTSFQALNLTTGTAVANAPVATLNNASGSVVTIAAGLEITLILASSLQAGANTLNLNGHGADAIKKHTNPANDIGTAYVTGSRVKLLFDGTVWQDMSQ